MLSCANDAKGTICLLQLLTLYVSQLCTHPNSLPLMHWYKLQYTGIANMVIAEQPNIYSMQLRFIYITVRVSDIKPWPALHSKHAKPPGPSNGTLRNFTYTASWAISSHKMAFVRTRTDLSHSITFHNMSLDEVLLAFNLFRNTSLHCLQLIWVFGKEAM